MKRIRGRALASVLRECRSLDDRLALLVHFRHVCEAIAYAHSRGVVHRDLKPDNVMVGEFAETLVVDWGLAKVRGESDPQPRPSASIGGTGSSRGMQVVSGSDSDAARTIDGHAIGTPAYMSPEQARGDLERIDERSDVWGLGAILFEILTGRPPYLGSAFDVVRQIRESRAPRVREVLPDAPPELCAIADRALMHDPSSRYPGAQELAAEIAAFQDGRQVRAYEYSAWDQVRRFVRRNRAASIAVAVVAVSTIVAAALITRSWLAEQRAREVAETRRDEAMAERERAVRGELASQVTLAEALLTRAERALSDGDPAAAAIYAAGALVRDPANPDSSAHADLGLEGDSLRLAEDRVVRAFSRFLEAEEARRWELGRRVAHGTGMEALSPDGARLAVPDGEHGFALVDLATGERTEVAGPHADAVLAFVGPDRVLVLGREPGVYDADSGTLAYRVPAAQAGAYAADRIALATAQGHVVVLDARSGAEIDRFETAHRGLVRVAWSRDGSHVAVTGRNLARVDVWPFPRRSAAPTAVAVGAWPRAIAFSPEGDRLAVAVNAPEVRVAELGPTVTVRSFEAPGGSSTLAWLSDGTLVVAEGADRIVLRRGREARVVETLHVEPTSGHRLHVNDARIVHVPLRGTAEASVFVPVEPGPARRSRRALDEAVTNVVWDRARQRLVAVTAGGISSIDVRRHRLGPPEEIARMPDEAGHPVDVAIAADGGIAVVTTLGALVVVEPGGEPRVAIAPSSSTQPLLGVAFDRVGDVVFSSSATDGRIRRWRRSRGAELEALEGHAGWVIGLTLSPDGATLASASEDGTVRLWDLEREPPTARAIPGHDWLVSHVAFSPDASRIAAADGRGYVRFYDVESGEARGSVRPHEQWINRIVWSHDGRRIVTASDDGTVRLSSGDGEDVLRIVQTSGFAIRGELSTDGTDLLVQDGEGVVRMAAEPGFSARDPEALLRGAEQRAGVRLDGLELLAIE
jgi:WD40 repeat protein